MKLLLVEDEAKLGAAIKRGLEQEGYAVDWQQTADDALAYGETENYDVMVFDRMLPGRRDGLDVCRQLRKGGKMAPVLFLTALGELSDRVEGLDGGGDDYLIKPFAFDELLARLRALTRRPVTAHTPQLKVGELVIDTTNKSVTIRGKKVRLSRKEFSLLEYLAHRTGQVLTKDQIIEHVWDFDSDILPNTVEVFVRSLRKKLDEPDKPSCIETVRGFGYKISEEIT